MRKQYVATEFRDLRDRNSGRVFSHLEFRRCGFIDSSLSITNNPQLRSRVQDVKFTDCTAINCKLNSAIIEDVEVEGLSTKDKLRSNGAVFKHVTLRGPIGAILLTGEIAYGMSTPSVQRAFDQANSRYYADVDWALDISEALFEDCDIRGIPAKLIRRDPRTQVIIKRERALDLRWQSLDYSRTYWDMSIKLFLARGDPDVVLVAPKLDSNFQYHLELLDRLRDIGVAEPE